MPKLKYPKHPAFDVFRVNNKYAKMFMHSQIYNWIKDFSKPEAQNTEYSKNTARSIVSLWCDYVGVPAPDFDKKTEIQKEPIKTNLLLRQEVTDEVIALALYYLEHGDINDDQRKYLHKILVKSSPVISQSKLSWFLNYMMATGIALVIFLMTYNNFGITPEQVKDVVLGWCVLSMGIDLGLLGSITLPRIYYTYKFNKTLQGR